MQSNNRAGLGLAAALGVSVLMIGLVAASPAKADDWHVYGRAHVYVDIADVRHDESILIDLEARRDEARRCHRWSEARSLDRDIADLRRHIDHDRRDIHADIRRDRDDYRVSDRYRRDRDDRRHYRDRDDRARYRDRDDR